MRKNTQKIILAMITAALSMSALEARAATLYWKDPSVATQKNAPFSTTLYLDTEGESINAIEGQVNFPAGVLSLSEIKDGNSGLTFWIEKPDVAAAKKGSFRFSGIIPGGFVGHDAPIFSLVFADTEEGGAAVSLADAHAYRNDPTGSEALMRVNAFHADISAAAGSVVSPSVSKDSERPETFIPEIASDTNLFDGKSFVVFDTIDKASGIDRYEILETKMSHAWLPLFSHWQTATSPHVLTDQAGQSYIFIKAIDRDGNARIERIAPAHPLSWYKDPNSYAIAVCVLAIIAVAILGWKKALAYRKKKRTYAAQ